MYQNPLFDWSGAVRLASVIAVRLRQHFFGVNRLVARGVFNPGSEAFRIQVAIFRQFAADVTRRGAHPLIVFLPDAGSLAQARAGRPAVYAPLASSLREAGIDYVDLGPAFLAAPDRDKWSGYFMPGGHYSRRGNAIVAAALAPALRARARAAAHLDLP
jgi:hypothetical protein